MSFALSTGVGDLSRRLLVLALVAVWGVRLGAYIHARNHGRGEDPRYAALMRRNHGAVVPYVLRTIYGPQGLVMWLVSLPVQVAMYERGGFDAATVVGVVLWVVGFGFEAGGDWQLARFRRDPANAGRLMDRGLWSLTRHPNYFGDACLWWGLFVISLSSWWALLGVFAPLLMTHMLVNKSGKALLERGMARRRGPEYAEYVRRTSGFLPRPPRRSAS